MADLHVNSIRGPAVFLAQFLRDEKPFSSIDMIAAWAKGHGYTGVQIPAWDRRAIDIELAAGTASYCDEYRALLADAGVVPTELAAYLAGQVLAVHPAYAELLEGLHPPGLSDRQRTAWAVDQIRKTIVASERLGLHVVPVLSGGFAWHLIYPWPRRPPGLIEAAMEELAARWRPLLDFAHERGVTLAYELHPVSDVFDGATFEAFLEATGDHPAVSINYDASHFVLQQLDYVAFIYQYGDRIKGFHVKDAEFNPTGRVGLYGGFLPWRQRAGRFRSPGDGQVDFRRVFTALMEVGFDGWAVLEWECCIKGPEQGAAEGAPFILEHIIKTRDVAFDDRDGGAPDPARNARLLGIATSGEHLA